MKSYTKFLSLLLTLVVSGIMFTSCDPEPKSNPNLAGMIAGDYVGSGSLQITGLNVDVESYPGMKLKVERSSDEYVIVTPYNADNTTFFASGGGTVYKVSRLTTGEFLLTNTDEVPMAQVNISKNREMTYYYPYVTVGGESGYALKFSGKRQN